MVIYRVNLLERFYYAGFSIKQRLALADRKRLPFKVISIGNLTTGGTGKTPAAVAVAREALRRGLAPIILTRGYKGSAKGPCFVTTGKEPLLSAAEGGDEPVLMASQLQGVPIVKGPDRYNSGVFAIDKLGLNPGRSAASTFFLLDDGFQHFRLFRDIDVVLIDAGNPFGGNRLLPSGRLREPLSSLGRAQVIVITKGGNAVNADQPETEEISHIIRSHNKTAEVFSATHRPVSALDRQGRAVPLSALSGSPVFGFCGIASPASFSRTLRETGAVISGFKGYPDHHSYTRDDIAELTKKAGESGCRWIVTTEKDIIKTGHLDLPENILIIGIEFSIDNRFYDLVLDEQYASHQRLMEEHR